jgi:hypothetical protein
MKLDVNWEIQELATIEIWGQPASKAFSCPFVVVKNILPSSQSSAVLWQIPA